MVSIKGNLVNIYNIITSLSSSKVVIITAQLHEYITLKSHYVMTTSNQFFSSTNHPIMNIRVNSNWISADVQAHINTPLIPLARIE